MNRRELILQGLRLACIYILPQIPHKKEKYTPRAVNFQDSCSVAGLIMSFPAKEFEVHPQRMRINAVTFSAENQANIIYNAYQ